MALYPQRNARLPEAFPKESPMEKTLCTMLVLLLAALSGLSEGLAPDGALEELLPAEDAASPALELPTDGPAEPEGPCEILPDLDGDAPLDLDGDILLNLDGDVPPGLDGDVPLSLDGDVSLDPGGAASDFDDILFESGVSNGATPAASGPVLLVAPEEEACFIRGGGDSDALFAAYANGLLRGGGLRANATAYARDKSSGTVLFDFFCQKWESSRTVPVDFVPPATKP